MLFTSQREAKQFLTNKIISQASREGSPLSDIDQRMLLFSEQEPETVEGFPEDVLGNIDQDYEKNITGLLKAAYVRDKKIPGEGQKYQDAYRKLNEGDHYILIMAAPVLGNAPLSGSEMSLRNICIAVAITLGVMICVAIIWVWFVSPRP